MLHSPTAVFNLSCIQPLCQRGTPVSHTTPELDSAGRQRGGSLSSDIPAVSVYSIVNETMTVAEQMIAIASSHIIAGHGAALAWPFLAGAQERAACIEIVIPHHPATYKSRSMYSRLAVAMAVHYQRIHTKFANQTKCPGAKKKERAILRCDNEARVDDVQPAVQRALDFIGRSRGRGSSGSNVWCANFRPCLAGQIAPKELVRPLKNTSRPLLVPVTMHSGADILRGSPGKWELHHSCVAYHRDHRNVTSVQFISRSNIFARIDGFVGSSPLAGVATVRPMIHATELDGCDVVGRAIAVSNLRREVTEAELLLPLGRDLPPTDRRTREALSRLLRSPCLCFEHVFGDTGPSPVVK